MSKAAQFLNVMKSESDRVLNRVMNGDLDGAARHFLSFLAHAEGYNTERGEVTMEVRALFSRTHVAVLKAGVPVKPAIQETVDHIQKRWGIESMTSGTSGTIEKKSKKRTARKS